MKSKALLIGLSVLLLAAGPKQVEEPTIEKMEPVAPPTATKPSGPAPSPPKVQPGASKKGAIQQAPVQPDRRPAMTPKAAVPPGGPRLERALKEAGQASSLKAIRDARDRSQLSPEEARAFDEALSRPPHSTKLEKLLREDEDLVRRRAEIKADDLARSRSRQLKGTQRGELARLNQNALMAVEGGGEEPVPTVFEGVTAEMRQLMRSPFESDEPESERPRIDRITPSPTSPGEVTTILGRNFGASRGSGSVTLLVDDGYFLLVPRSWGDEHVEVTIPELLAEGVGEGEMSATVWVKPDGRVRGPTAELQIVPAPAALLPEVTSISPGEIRPGQILLISGRGFLSAPGEVRFTVSPLGVTVDGIIDHWDDDSVAAHLPEDLDGFASGATASVELENQRGNDVAIPSSVALQPNLEADVLADICGHSRTRRSDPESHDCTLFDFTMANDWTVTDSRIDHDPFCRGYCEYVAQPSTGSDSPRSVIRNHVTDHSLGSCYCWSYVSIEGPAGLAPR